MTLDPGTLLAGPRGRRLLLAFATAGRHALGPEDPRVRLGSAVMLVSYRLDPGRGTSRVLFGPGAEELLRAPTTPDDVARLLTEAPLPDPTPAALLDALTEAVDHARYWQEPDGEDVLLATPAVRRALVRIAEHVAGSPHASWWSSPVDRAAQRTVTWETDDARPPSAPVSAAEALAAWRAETVADERRARRERPTDPTASWSGVWWSTPALGLTRTCRDLAGHGPLGLRLVEDSLGWERAATGAVVVPGEARVFEVDGAAAWAALCRAHPLDVTAQKRHDWFRTTGRDGAWVMPDWQGVAEEFDGVHLTVAGYLAAAGTAIPVGDAAASVIAGWNPDETVWLRDVVGVVPGTARWRRDDDGAWSPEWTRP